MTDTPMTEAWPTALKVEEQGRVLSITFDDASAFKIPAELLRVESPSAEVKGHGPGQEQLVWGKRDVMISGAVPVGNYAVRLKFSDGHDTGLFTWTYLATLGRDQEKLMAAYEQKLKDAGLRR
jgi:DUF971 family protein